MAISSLWGEEFSIDDTQQKNKELLKKLNSSKSPQFTVQKALKSKKLSVNEKLEIIYENVKKKLGVYQEQTILIKSIEELDNYLEKSRENGVIAIDTETNKSLDPLTCRLMGVCIYTPGMKNAYIPINHVDKDTRVRLTWQLNEQDINDRFSKINDLFIITHNGKFDYEVLKCTTGWEMKIDWDTMIAARLLNENERAGLKQQYIEKIDSSIEKYSIEEFFKDIEYEVVDPAIFALYAATDSFMTYKLYEYQYKLFMEEDNKRLFNLYKQVEMPIVKISADMELRGICLDVPYCERLKNKYEKYLKEIDEKIDAELLNYKTIINNWRLTPEAQNKPVKDGKIQKSKNEQLKDPIELTSTTQLAILLYDILKVPVVSKKTPRGTGAEILEQIDLPLCKLLIEQKQILKLLTAFIETLPTKISPRDSRLHSHFNQLGTDTGRFSSTEPNLQQIPSRNKEVRMMFSAQPGCTLVGSDFSAQEPRILAAYSRDEKMLQAFAEDKDIYATVGSGIFKNDYWDNMEHHQDGSDNVDGKKRRSKCKKLILGMSYGMGAKKMSDNMNCTLEEGKKIIEDFGRSFPRVQQWIEQTKIDASKVGYVEDYAGRKRHLPDLLLPEYEIVDENAKNNFNPLLDVKVKISSNSNLIGKYKSKLANCKSLKEKEAVKAEAKKENITIHDNGGFISRSERQCVNARIQGGAATMTKKAMIAIDRDKEINDLGFKLLICVHDELIGECPKENAEKVSERLSYLMRTCVPELPVAFKCDAEVEEHWYENEYAKMIRNERDKMLLAGNSLAYIFEKLCKEHSECTKEQINAYLNG